MQFTETLTDVASVSLQKSSTNSLIHLESLFLFVSWEVSHLIPKDKSSSSKSSFEVL